MTKLTAIVERPVLLPGSPANALVNFSGHTVSLVAVTAVRQGKPVVGVAFNSIGRFAQSGILRDRLIPRVLAASPDALLDDSGRIDPAAVLACALADEKPGGHGYQTGPGRRPGAGVLGPERQTRDEPAYATIARRFGREPAPTVAGVCRRRLLLPA